MDLSTVLFAQLEGALPLIVAGVVPLIVAAGNKLIGDRVPKPLLPILLPLLGALLAGVAKAVGFDVGDFNPETADLTMWQTVIAGALVGSASVGLHQAKAQLQRLPDLPPPRHDDDGD